MKQSRPGTPETGCSPLSNMSFLTNLCCFLNKQKNAAKLFVLFIVAIPNQAQVDLY